MILKMEIQNSDKYSWLNFQMPKEEANDIYNQIETYVLDNKMVDLCVKEKEK